MKEYLKKHRFEFAIVSFMSVLLSAIIVGISLVLQYVVDWSMEGQVKNAVILSLAFVAVLAVIYWLQASGQVHLNTKVMKEIRERIVKKILAKSNAAFKEHEETDYISLVQNDVKKIEDNYLDKLFSCIVSFTQLSFAIVVMTRYSPVFTVTMLGMTAAMFVVPAFFSKKLEKATKNVSDAQEELTSGMSEVVYGFEVTKSFHKESYREGKFSVCNNALRKMTNKLEITRALNAELSNILGFSMQMVICILAGFFIYQKKLSYGSMVGVIQVSGSITSPLFQLFSLIPALKAFKPIFEKISEYTAGEEEDAAVAEKSWNRISLSDVSFSYDPSSENKVLKGIDLTIEKGKKYLIVGESGCGKTTLVNILAGKTLPSSGNVLIDGKATPQAGSILQRLSSGVWQNVFLFNDSIKENILMGDADEGDLSKALTTSALSDVTNEKGLDFVVGANGDQLSGGQKQRIAIARALHADKDILIMDEGLSALNEDMGERIEKALLSDPARTVISISHHASEDIRRMYDEIIELKDGKVA